jgi:hypothetical protein
MARRKSNCLPRRRSRSGSFWEPFAVRKTAPGAATLNDILNGLDGAEAYPKNPS